MRARLFLSDFFSYLSVSRPLFTRLSYSIRENEFKKAHTG